ncbi:hypothetical protein [Paenibacillus wynnii]|uniref:Uncharacterized protein n=1 Tax=Paenibacillus wynnii TaxID=268407 RepID=A0A098MEJ1_9BACL|nr:hypothetical protein [Paenibacillus wynnii]KGE20970.1 hypothetical protein PWYN_02080 [Paenibacillus wynnii]
MNVLILLLSLLTPYLEKPAQQEPLSAAAFSRPVSAVFAFQHTQAVTTYINRFESLSDVELFTTEEELIDQKGLPLNIQKDPWQGCLEYQYEELSAGICEGIVLYVHVTPHQAQEHGLSVNGIELDPEKGYIQDLLGAPDFKAEDGDVYIRGSNALKIYRDQVSGKWLGIDLFDGNSS